MSEKKERMSGGEAIAIALIFIFCTPLGWVGLAILSMMFWGDCG